MPLFNFPRQYFISNSLRLTNPLNFNFQPPLEVCTQSLVPLFTTTSKYPLHKLFTRSFVLPALSKPNIVEFLKAGTPVLKEVNKSCLLIIINRYFYKRCCSSTSVSSCCQALVHILLQSNAYFSILVLSNYFSLTKADCFNIDRIKVRCVNKSFRWSCQLCFRQYYSR